MCHLVLVKRHLALGVQEFEEHWLFLSKYSNGNSPNCLPSRTTSSCPSRRDTGLCLTNQRRFMRYLAYRLCISTLLGGKSRQFDHNLVPSSVKRRCSLENRENEVDERINILEQTMANLSETVEKLDVPPFRPNRGPMSTTNNLCLPRGGSWS